MHLPPSTLHYPRFIGLLGGSFNPAHAGHVHLSREALRRLGLNEVWWLVAPRNPLKAESELADYPVRLEKAARVAAACPRIRVSDVEARLGTRYTVDTLDRLKKRYPRARFVWLMGADNLAELHRWKQWPQVLASVPVAVFDRAPYPHAALRAMAAQRFSRFRVPEKAARVLIHKPSPAWTYIHMPRCNISATRLRETLKKGAF